MVSCSRFRKDHKLLRPPECLSCKHLTFNVVTSSNEPDVSDFFFSLFPPSKINNTKQDKYEVTMPRFQDLTHLPQFENNMNFLSKSKSNFYSFSLSSIPFIKYNSEKSKKAIYSNVQKC